MAHQIALPTAPVRTNRVDQFKNYRQYYSSARPPANAAISRNFELGSPAAVVVAETVTYYVLNLCKYLF